MAVADVRHSGRGPYGRDRVLRLHQAPRPPGELGNQAASADPGPGAGTAPGHFQSWRYTDVHNGCGDTVSVTVGYVNGQWAPCRVIQPGGWATFSGYGTSGNYVAGLRTCDPAIVPAGDVRAAPDIPGRVDASAVVGWHLGASDCCEAFDWLRDRRHGWTEAHE
ncbi:hypothetical protein ABZZ37_18395 [Streptomyces sp. NPDC006464]|uniref:hypothetical protein n=1 Tax=Streptomyces sp. NPDC006464 TaxID=3154305 RepID=UPI0033AC0622